MNEFPSFCPDWVSPPGSTINDLLREHSRTLPEFSRAMSGSVHDIQQLLTGSLHITEAVADDLAKELGVPAKFWISRESKYRQGLAKWAEKRAWLKDLPVSDMETFGWIQRHSNISEKIAACLEFFGVLTVDDWYKNYRRTPQFAAFRKSKKFDSKEGAVIAWLRKGEIEGELRHCENWDAGRFRAALSDIRELTRKKEPSIFIPELQTLCAKCGVVVVVARAPSGCMASGAARFISSNKAILMLSFRYLSDDHFWFTFFHEAAHLLLHDPQRLFLEGNGYIRDEEEKEANNFAANVLVPLTSQETLRSLPADARAVMRFAKSIGISPGIVVGQMQHHELLDQRYLNQLKVRYAWK